MVDSSADPDGKFADSWFAYAWIGGPFTVMTYDNNGWGISRMNNVIAHESAHIFYALDEYSGGSSYNSRSGYYNTQNLNAADGNPNPSNRVASIMSDGNSQLTAWSQNTSSPSSLEMLGWRDSDGNGIFDVLDVPLSLSGTGSIDQNTGIYSFSGFSSVNTLNNQNPFGLGNDITINTVDMIQYRIDGGQWIDGNLYGDYTANVTQDVQFTSDGQHTIDFRTTVSQTGLTSNIISDTFSFSNSLPGITISALPDLTTTEAGGIATFDVVLNSQPTDDVTLTVASDDPSEGNVSPVTASLTFTSDNWDTPQSVTVIGADDALDDGDINYNINLGPATSSDANYNDLVVSPVAVTNTDDDEPPIPVEVIVDNQDAAGFATTGNWLESGAVDEYSGSSWYAPVPGMTATWTPDLPVGGTYEVYAWWSALRSNGTLMNRDSQAQYAVTHNGITDTYTVDQDVNSGQWVLLDTLTFTGNGSETVTLTASAEAAATTGAAIADAVRFVKVADPAPTPGITISALPGLTTTEAGGTATFDVVLNSQPTDDVTLTVASDDLSEGNVSPATASLTFTPDNWDTPQSVTVIGANDTLDDGNISYNILLGPATSNDTDYNDLAVSPVAVTNTDDDEPPILVEVIVDNQDAAGFNTTGTWLESSAVDEYSGSSIYSQNDGDTATWTPDLPASGTYEVYAWWSAVKSDGGTFNRDSQAQYAVTHNGITDTYTVDQDVNSGQWVLLDTLTFTGDGNESVTLTNSDTNPNAAIADAVRFVKVADPGPAPSITISALPGLTTTEAGGTATFDVVLNSQPTDDVTLTAASDDPSEGNVSPATASLTFTPDNWDTPQSVTVIGANDTLDDGNISYNILLGPATSNDTDYNDLAVSPVAVTNTDDDEPPIPVEVIVDNQDAAGFATTGNWLESGAVDEYSGSSWYAPVPGMTATWTPDLPVGGTYEVYAWWSALRSNGTLMNRDSQAQYAVTHNGITDTYTVDQDVNSGQWVLLDTLTFTGNGSETVTLTASAEAAATTGAAIADAVRFVKV